MPSFRTPTALARGLGAAGSGTRDFWHQRVTSALGVLMIAGVVTVIAGCIGSNYGHVAARFGNPVVAIILLLALLNFCIHMRIGMQVVIEDYVHESLAKTALLIVNTGFCAAMGVAGAAAVLKLALAA